MKTHCSTTSELNGPALQDAGDARTETTARCGYYDRISQIIERGVLVFVVLVTLLCNYASHSHLMREVLLA